MKCASDASNEVSHSSQKLPPFNKTSVFLLTAINQVPFSTRLDGNGVTHYNFTPILFFFHKYLKSAFSFCKLNATELCSIQN